MSDSRCSLGILKNYYLISYTKIELIPTYEIIDSSIEIFHSFFKIINTNKRYLKDVWIIVYQFEYFMSYMWYLASLEINHFDNDYDYAKEHHIT